MHDPGRVRGESPAALCVFFGGAWVAEVPAIGGCCALMDTRAAALTELHHVFRLIAVELAVQDDLVVRERSSQGQ